MLVPSGSRTRRTYPAVRGRQILGFLAGVRDDNNNIDDRLGGQSGTDVEPICSIRAADAPRASAIFPRVLELFRQLASVVAIVDRALLRAADQTCFPETPPISVNNSAPSFPFVLDKKPPLRSLRPHRVRSRFDDATWYPDHFLVPSCRGKRPQARRADQRRPAASSRGRARCRILFVHKSLPPDQ